jgi:hypothetical protein
MKLFIQGKKGVAAAGVFLMVCVTIISGCTSRVGETSIAYETRQWASRTYRFDIQIDTEPAGARIYIQDIYVGQSPLLTKIKATDVTITQSGSYPQRYSFDWFSGRVTRHLRTGNTTWNHKLSGRFQSDDYGWALKIYKDGFEPLEYRITRASLKQFDKAIDSLEIYDNDKLPFSFSAAEPEYFAFTLKPAGVSNQPTDSKRPAACQQVPNEQTKAIAAAGQEY